MIIRFGIFNALFLLVYCDWAVGSISGPPVQHCDLPYCFTLAAYNETLHNDNSTGVPLVVGQNGVITGAAYKVVSTFLSYPYNEYHCLRLVDCTLRIMESNKTSDTIGNFTSPGNGSFLSAVISSLPIQPAPRTFSVVEDEGNSPPPPISHPVDVRDFNSDFDEDVDIISPWARQNRRAATSDCPVDREAGTTDDTLIQPHKYPRLAVYGSYTSWYLCPSNKPRGQTNVVFNMSAENPPPNYYGIAPENCYPVSLHVIPSLDGERDEDTYSHEVRAVDEDEVGEDDAGWTWGSDWGIGDSKKGHGAHDMDGHGHDGYGGIEERDYEEEVEDGCGVEPDAEDEEQYCDDYDGEDV